MSFFIEDFFIFYFSLLVAVGVRNFTYFRSEWMDHFILFFPLFLIYEVILYISGLNDKHFIAGKKQVFDKLLPAHAISLLIMALYFYMASYLGNHIITPRANLIIFSILLFAFIYLWKVYKNKLLGSNDYQVILIGDDSEIESSSDSDNLLGFNITKKLDIHNTIDLYALASGDRKIDAVIVDIDHYPHTEVLYDLVAKNIQIVDLITLKEELSDRIDLEKVSDKWLIKNLKINESGLSKTTKRAFDLILAIPVTIIYITVLPILYFLITRDGGTAFFEMPRVGKGGQVFQLRKFRSMSPDHFGTLQIIDHEKVITKLGYILRKTGLDELPQVMHVIRGEMSFIGPRPEIPELVKKYSKEIKHYNMRHLVTPGLSGWAQVMQEIAPHHKADSQLTREKLAYDLYYIKNHSVFLYIIIVLKTLKSLLNRTNH
ncbi:MAG: sugar transferase [Thiotrichaceae bacterium]|nr:sugar transferase [Thiotrichaceae bacterium]